MPEPPDFTSDASPTLQQLATFFADEIFDKDRLVKVEHALRNAHAYGATTANAAEFAAKKKLAIDENSMTKAIEEWGGAVSAWALSLVVENAFDVDIDNSAFARLGAKAGRRAVAKAITDKMVAGLTGGNTSLDASPQPAANYLSVVFAQVFEAWALGEIVEIGSALVPGIDKVEHIADLGDKLVGAMGITDSSARVLRPYIDNLVVEPLRRHIARTYRPNLLSEAMAVRQFLRGVWSRERLDTELALQGWDPERIDAQINNAQRFLSFDDAVQISRGGGWDRAKVVDNLQQQGYSLETAQLTYEADRRKRFDAIWSRVLSPALSAHANRDIQTGELKNLLAAIVEDAQERELWAHIGDTLRELNVKHLSHGEVIECVELGVLAVADYRHWLEREGYPQDDRFALELRLRVRLDKDRDVEAARRRLETERAEEKAARLAAAAERLAQVEAERALQRRGSIADLRRAAVRGLITFSRLREVLDPQYDSDTVQIILDGVEADRQDYLAQLKAADEAKRRAAVRNVDVGALESAVLEHVLTVQQFRGRLGELLFAPSDADLLTATLAAKLKDRDDATAKRIAAEAAAKRKSIDLARFEALVRRGHRTLADYAALLRSLDFDDAAQAGMLDLLQLQIDDDAAARRIREDAAAKRQPIGLSLDQFRRAVILGIRTIDAFATYLIQQGYTSDAQIVLLAELRRDVDDAEAARRRRAEADTQRGVAVLSLARVAQAARLGFITPAAYQARLERDGYSKDDIAIEMELLIAEIADTQAARARREELARAAAAPQAISLGQLERAVRAGVASIQDYRAAAAGLYGLDDVDLLVETLQAELNALNEARLRRTSIDGELTARTLSLGQLEAGVKLGAVSLKDYHEQLIEWGYGSDDADLLSALLFEQLVKTGAGS